MSLLNKKSSGSIVAIDIGSNSYKIVQGRVERNKLVVERATSSVLPEDTYQDGVIYNGDLLAESIKGTLRDSKFSSSNAVLTISSSATVIREITLPAVKQNDLKDMIGYEIQQYLPIELNQYVIQHRIIGDLIENGTKFTNVLVAALPKDLVESHLNLLQTIGLNPIALDINSNCIEKLFTNRKINNENVFKEQTSVFLDVGHLQTHLSLYERGIYQFDRLLKMGVNDIDNNIASITGKYLEDAVIIRRNLSNINYAVEDTEEEGRVINAARTTVDSWMDEIVRIFKFYTSRRSLNKIDIIYLFGGGASIKGLDVYLERSLGYKVELITDIEGINSAKFELENAGVNLGKDNSDYDEFQAYINALGALIRL